MKDAELPLGVVEEDDVEREPHPEGVHAPAPGNQKARSGLGVFEARKAEEPRDEAAGDRNHDGPDRAALETPEPVWRGRHTG